MSLNPWESLYKSGRQLNRYPWDVAVTFVTRHAPKDKPRSNVEILEVGCGTGSNLWFAAREGFNIAGLDISETAIRYATNRFTEENLRGGFVVGDLRSLPFDGSSFDLVIDRAAITCLDQIGAARSIASIHAVLRRGGYFLFTPYSDRCDALRSQMGGLGGAFLENITDGGLADLGGIRFYSHQDVTILFQRGWRLESIREVVSTDHLGKGETIAIWQVIAEKT